MRVAMRCSRMLSIDLIIEVRVTSGGWVSGSGGMGITGVVFTVVRGGAGEEWRCRRSVVVTRWCGSESCTLGVVLVVGKVVCLPSGCVGEYGLADVTLGVRAFGCAVVYAAVGAWASILGGWGGGRWCRGCGTNVLWTMVVGFVGALAVVVKLRRWGIVVGNV
jgi:hypothetical protein